MCPMGPFVPHKTVYQDKALGTYNCEIANGGQNSDYRDEYIPGTS